MIESRIVQYFRFHARLFSEKYLYFPPKPASHMRSILLRETVPEKGSTFSLEMT